MLGIFRGSPLPFESMDPGSLEFLRQDGLSLMNHTHLGGRSTHVKGEEILLSDEVSVKGSSKSACRRPRLDHSDGKPLSRIDG